MTRVMIITSAALFALASASLAMSPTQLADRAVPSYHLGSGVYEIAALANANGPSAAYVSVAVPLTEIESLKTQVATATGLTLKNRGEAHITVLTPPELAAIRKHLSAADVLNALGSGSLQEESFDIVCLGAGKKQQGRTTKYTYFVVVKADGIADRRRQLARAFQAAGGTKAAFDPQRFYPHITVGFTHTDLFEQDGVIKDPHSCVAPIAITPAGDDS